MKFILLFIVAFFFLIISSSSVYAANTFTDVTSTAGVAGPTGNERGSSWIDIDNDGDLDLYLMFYQGNNRLYLNDGDGTFTEDTSGAIYGLTDGTDSHWGVTWFDIDNDKDFDLYISNLLGANANSLYINNGPGTAFTEDSLNTYALNLTAGNRAYSIPFDVDEDGDYDLLVYSSAGSKMMINNGTSSAFTEDTTYGLNAITNGNTINLLDVENDGDFDLYVVSVLSTNKLWINNGPGNTFTESASSYGVAHVTNAYHESAAIGDMNNDGYQDILVATYTAFGGYNLILYVNNNGNSFTDESSTYDIVNSASGGTYSTNWIDIDNDGDLDAYIHQSHTSGSFPNRLYINNGTGVSFTESASDYGITSTGSRHLNNTWVDYDNDGDLDLYVSRETSNANSLFNNPGQGNNYFHVQVNNSNGFFQYNARVEIDLDGNNDFSTAGDYVMQYQSSSSRGGVAQYLQSVDPSSIHFGLGSDSSCKYDVRIFLPGTSPSANPDYSFENVCPNQTITTGRTSISSTNQPVGATSTSVTGTVASTVTYSTITGLEAQAGGTSGTWTTCTANDGSFNSTSEQFTCSLPLTSLSSDGLKSVHYRASTSVGSVFTALDYIDSTSTLNHDTSTATSSTGVSVYDPETGRTFNKYFKTTTVGDLSAVTDTEFPIFCFTKAYDTPGGSGISHYTLRLDGRDYIANIPYISPSFNEYRAHKEGEATVVKEFDDYTLKYVNYDRISENQQICAWGRGEKMRLNTGFHIWSVKVIDHAGNNVEAGNSRFLVGSFSGSFSGNISGTAGWGENDNPQSTVWFPLVVLQIGNKITITDITTVKPTFFNSSKPYIISTPNPTFYGITNVGSTVTLTIEKQEVDPITGSTQKTLITKETTKGNESSNWGINVSKETPLQLNSFYFATLFSQDDSGNIALIKDIPIIFSK